MNPRVAIVTNVIPSYRRAFYERLVATLGDRLTIYCQTHIPGMNLKVEHEHFRDNVRLVNCLSLDHEKVAWQRLPIRALLRDHDVYFFTGNPRVLSTLFWATVLRLLGRPVVIWGQAHTAGAHGWSETLRLTWWRLFNFLLLYGDSEIDALRARGFKARMIGINNGLDQRAIDAEQSHWTPDRLMQWRVEQGIERSILLLSCARLEAKNRFELMLKALPNIRAQFPDVLWVVIGDGAEREILQQSARELGVDAHIRWLGAEHAEERLCPWFLSSVVFVHPAAIGLSLLHAFGYGLPVVTHSNADGQMPEFHTMPPRNRAYCYREGDSTDLANRIIDLIGDDTTRQRLSDDARDVAQLNNVDVMAARFMEMVSACNETSGTIAQRQSGEIRP